MDISITQIYQYLARIMGETTNEKSHYELLRDEILVHRKFYDETGKRVERKTLDEFAKWREEQKQKENKQGKEQQEQSAEEGNSKTIDQLAANGTATNVNKKERYFVKANRHSTEEVQE